ncbi:VMAP-C domain-containing protein [Amycolatopsis pigmentata]|uniref:Guanylate cyclase domain-containing protein n=1 Tax=Amycolatopsis pigmentata TaxID=450801 RepID=A0ABW5FVC2_9PSEU
MPQLSPTVHRTILMVDVADFTNPSRIVADLMDVQEGVYEVLRTAFAESGVDFDSCQYEDRGDGALILIPPEFSKSKLADLLPGRLDAELRRHNSTRSPQSRFKLRVGIHAGDIRRNAHGWVGHAVNLTARILEAAEVKSALTRSNGLLALVTSDYFYTEVIAQDPGIAPETYRRIDVAVKKFSGAAWLRIPGESSAPSQTAPARPAGTSPDRDAEEVLAIVPEEELAKLRGLLSGLQVAHPATLVARAAGQAIPPPRSSSAWDIFCYLLDFNANADGLPPALAYLKLLAGQWGGDIETEVSAWVDQQTRRMRIDAALDEVTAESAPIPEIPRLYLMIAVEPDAVDAARCVLSFWRQDDPLSWPPVRGGIREVALDELEYRVDETILAAEQAWADQAISVVVEFVLARGMLGLPVHRWCKEHRSGEPRPLAFDYQIGLRSLERMRTKYWHRRWKQRWRSLPEHLELERIHPFGTAETSGGIDAVLSDPRWAGLVMEGPPSPRPEPGTDPDEFTAALRAGLPLICWHPAARPEDLRKHLGWLIGGEGGFADIPQRRQNALRSNRHDLVYDLAVMWEDPYRVIDFDPPSIAGRR